MTLYNCKSEITTDGDRYRITKFDSETMEVESSYALTVEWCDCPAGVRPTCRHREMLPKFIARNAINTFLFLDFGSGAWIDLNPEPEDPPFVCKSCNSKGFEPSILPDQCTFCDGTFGGNPPSPDSVAVSTGDFDSPSVGSNPAQAASPFTRRF